MSAHEETAAEVVRWYTRARRFPQLIGRTPDGTHLPGGPYTFTQVIVTAVFLVVAVMTVKWWGPFDLIGNVMTLALSTVGVIWGVGRIPVGARNPLSAIDGSYRALAAPGTGHVRGRPIRLHRPSRVRGIVVVHASVANGEAADPTLTVPASPPEAAAPEPAVGPPASAAGASHAPTPPAETPAQAPARPLPAQLTGVQKLLASPPTRPRKAA